MVRRKIIKLYLEKSVFHKTNSMSHEADRHIAHPFIRAVYGSFDFYPVGMAADSEKSCNGPMFSHFFGNFFWGSGKS